MYIIYFVYYIVVFFDGKGRIHTYIPVPWILWQLFVPSGGFPGPTRETLVPPRPKRIAVHAWSQPCQFRYRWRTELGVVTGGFLMPPLAWEYRVGCLNRGGYITLGIWGLS